MINFHPTGEQLTLFAEGALTPEEAVVLSAHVDLCARCNDEFHQKTELLAAKVFHLNEPMLYPFQHDSMVENITSSTIKSAQPVQGSSHFSKYIRLDSLRFTLPRTLRKFAIKAGGWSYLAGKTWQAGIEFSSKWQASFMYLEKGGHIPEHKYGGKSFWLVIDGELNEGNKVYRKGDFVAIAKDASKAPHSNDEKGCLLFTLLEKPLVFSTGLTNLLNPSSHLYF
ncbi:zf-HC2 domain-containing protein [Alteromonas sp. ASW11-130]|uniref:zf-HC2 domain-containing protein n=1 Tax=Alteromonas sp. ASW11-130 TaxID=3015775 RepID=UPI002241D6FA|nr:zf-HC2 domain-containing protein [Alteromonas sp. ASW11-130]MCW8093025.1 zf-HC2 domain-containing protein [Alteromonas sp. ASW11-130]